MPGNIARLLEEEISLPSLEHLTDEISRGVNQAVENLKKVEVGEVGKGLEEAGKNLQKSVEGLLPKRKD